MPGQNTSLMLCVGVCVCDERYFSLGAIFYYVMVARHVIHDPTVVYTSSSNTGDIKHLVMKVVCNCCRSVHLRLLAVFRVAFATKKSYT